MEEDEMVRHPLYPPVGFAIRIDPLIAAQP